MEFLTFNDSVMDYIKGICSVALGALVDTGLALTSFSAIEVIIPHENQGDILSNKTHATRDNTLI